MNPSATLPIGIFDSGMGGLTVLKAISGRLPGENLLYLGDTARLPYGTKSRDTIIRYTLKAAGRLVDEGVKMLVVACNTATSAALPELREHFAPLPVLGVVRPGAEAAVAASRNKRIVVIATEATIAGGAYQQAIASLCPEARVQGRACTLFVPLAEEGWMDGPIVEGIASRYLGDLFSPGRPDRPDTLVLGCTHFPLLAPAIHEAFGRDLNIVSSAEETAREVAETLARRNQLVGPEATVRHRFATTSDDITAFAAAGKFIFGGGLTSIEHIDISELEELVHEP